MRPLELTVRNFRSYFGDGHVFDFRDRGLVGVVGPIGSGKSSLLDAVSFALYGKTATAGANTKSLIHQRTADGAVMLRFEVEGEVWEVVRSLRRKGASQHALYRYETDTPEAEPVDRITLEGDVNERIADLLGLDYDAFGRSVLLAQGRFAEFLKSRPAERDAVLKGVFGHDKIDTMRQIAKQRVEAIAQDLAHLTVRTEQLERVAVRLAEAREALDGAERRVAALRKIEPRLEELNTRIAGAVDGGQRAGTRLAELEPHTSRLPEPASIDALVTHAAAHAEERARLAAALEEAQADVVAADAALAAAEADGMQRSIDEAAQLLATAEPQRRAVQEAAARLQTSRRRLAELEAQHTRAVEAAEAADRHLEEMVVAVEGATLAMEQTAQALHDAEHADMAASLRMELAAGKPCPVCDQVVGDVPAPDPAADVAAATRAATEARTARTGAEAAHTAAAAAASAAGSERDALEASVVAARGEMVRLQQDHAAAHDTLSATMDRIVATLGEGDPAALLDALRRQMTGLTSRIAEARRHVDQVRASHDQAIRDEQAVGKRLAALRIELADLAARVGANIVVESEDATAIGRAAAEVLEAWNAHVRELQTVMNDAKIEQRSAEEERAVLLGDAGVTGDFGSALGAAQATAEHLSERVRRDAAEIDASEDLFAEQARLEAEHGRYDRLVADLTNARFVRFLLDDERTRLGHLGSEHFQRLSSGRYRFTDDGTFAIVDLTAADAVRKSASLSGGETFLASLALALSLAEMVMRTGGRLDAFFLDEGFGSLDPEHLDLAMEGIEALVAGTSDRLVVVVSHVPELRHRIEDLIVLDRDPATGDTRVLQR